MLKKISLFLFVMSAFSSVFAQSAEPGQIFNKYSAAEDGVNLLAGTSSLNRNLVSISSGNVSASVELDYFGNVSESVSNRNDIAPTSWVGLGWSLGHARIISENAGTMWLGDDSYYLVTASGVKYSIVKSDDGSGKWWIESLLYWTIEQNTQNVDFDGKNYTILVGWTIVDNSGNTYVYGDGFYDKESPNPNATEYTLANPYSAGIVGVVDGGKDELFPVAWNLKQQKDLEGNFIDYTYDQFRENVLIRNAVQFLGIPYYIPSNYTRSKNAYTKECYLKTITSSQGVRATFKTKEKDFDNEYIDRKGNVERDNQTPDAFIDPLQRRYLSQIVVEKEILNNEGEKVFKSLKNIDFCYKSLDVNFNASTKSSGKISDENNSPYVKRLLTSVVESSEEGEIHKEIYTYYENDFDPKTNLAQNIGALHTVKSNDCGVVEYVYKQQTVEETASNGMLYAELPVTKAAMGSLKDGTVYLLGMNSTDKSVQVFHRINNKWVLKQTLSNSEEIFTDDGVVAEYSTEGSFIAGDEDWFVYVEKQSKKTLFKPFQWDGAHWVNHGEIIDDENRDVVEVGPGYIVTARLRPWNLSSLAKIEVKLRWSVWGGFSDEVVMTDDVDDDDDDRKFVYITTSKNHFAVFYKDRYLGNSGRLAILSFGPDKSILKDQIFTESGLDDDNHYGFVDDNILVGGVESRGITGQYAVAYHAYEKGKSISWNKVQIQKLHGWQCYVDIMSMGEGYFVLRHNDYDDMSLFEFDGEKWNAVYDNENMVHHQDFDPKTEADWDAISGYNFFVARRPQIIEHWYGNAIRPQREFELITKNANGKWKRGETSRRGDDGRKHIYAGTDWFAVKEIKETSINNGREWKNEIWNNSFLNHSWEGVESCIKSLHGDYLTLDFGSKTLLYYKKNDSFTSNINAFFVSKKIVEDPISAKTIEYAYDFRSYTSGHTPIYDYVSKSPVVRAFTVSLPEKIGTIEKFLCNNVDGVGKGQICRESFYPRNSLVASESVSRTYTRYRGPNDSWPGSIYVDQLANVMYKNNHLSSGEFYTYSDLNGEVNSIKKKDYNANEFVSEEKKIFAAELNEYENLKSENRLTEVAAVYKCVPDCENGSVVSGKANKYAEFETQEPKKTSRYRVAEEWNYAPKGNDRDAKFTFSWKKNSLSPSWEKVKTISSYTRNVATQIVNQLGIKSSIVLDEGKSNIIHASVVNAGLDEILVVSGDTCGVSNVTSCETAYLNGRYFELPKLSNNEK